MTIEGSVENSRHRKLRKWLKNEKKISHVRKSHDFDFFFKSRIDVSNRAYRFVFTIARLQDIWKGTTNETAVLIKTKNKTDYNNITE